MRLQPFGLWSEQFTEALAILCRTYADYRQARRDAEGQPHVLVRSDGCKYMNPLWGRVRGLMADWMKLDREFRVVRR